MYCKFKVMQVIFYILLNVYLFRKCYYLSVEVWRRQEAAENNY